MQFSAFQDENMTIMLTEYLHDIQVSLKHDKLDEPYLRSNLCMLKAMERNLPMAICEARDARKSELLRLQNNVSIVLGDVLQRLKHDKE